MPDQNDENVQMPEQQTPIAEAVDGVIGELIQKINDSRNILVALSKNPSVDEIAAAIGLSMYLERIGKNTTAIYSGETPNALEFLNPEETFERSADVLQDFVIALDKEKADHLRYKVDGDFVKIYITPYKTKVSSADLDFSYGDFNVDLVFALDVSNGVELDSALREHGRIMHDAVIVNVTTSAPGKFGEIEWSDQSASSVSEMIAKLLTAREETIAQDEATALLTGIVAATNSFSNARTTSDTMKMSSKLMDAGANQQLVSMHIKSDTENELYEVGGVNNGEANDLMVSHEDEPETLEPTPVSEPVLETPVMAPVEAPVEAPAEVVVEEPIAEPASIAEPIMESFNQDLTEAGNNFAMSAEKQPIENPIAEPVVNEPTIDYGAQGITVTPPDNNLMQPAEEESGFNVENDSDKYGKMLEDALNEQNSVNPAADNTPVAPVEPEVNGVPVINYTPAADEILTPPPAPVDVNEPMAFEETPIEMPVEPPMAYETAPVVEPVQVETPVMGAPVEPIAPAPVETPVAPAAPVEAPVAPVAMPEPVYTEPVQQAQGQEYTTPPDDPTAFKIPGM